MRIILTGVTGVAGLGIYRAALADPSIQRVTLLTRRAVPSWAELPANATEKTDVILHSDFKTYPDNLAKRLAEHDALIWALGKSAVGMSKEAYTELTYEYTMSAARALKNAGAGSPEKPFRFVWISGELANPEGTSGQMWANVKGRVERELPQLFEGTNIKVHIFRPGYFFPSKEYPQDRMNQRGAFERIVDTVSTPMFSFFPSFYTPLGDLGRFSVELAKGHWPSQVMYRNAEMRKLVKTLPPLGA
ncbi:hypothetical protein GSI_10936 [Ganoderma sinense ZZ0214-1]|uniref:NAD(P)-binding domain-containing protein n=1 Tax=Ganoderma sinense ZZ0214-1 TaxID=1077348 RepID=A0A2G8S1Y2_9APHY|nr:hypothetical protein GSI_10936 [Ganoderma sinense ZZ0214-1]